MKKPKFEKEIIRAREGTKILEVYIQEEGLQIEIVKISNTAEDYEEIEKYFPIVEASKLSLQDEFLKCKLKTDKQRALKKLLVTAIKSGLKDFRVQRIDPCLDEEGRIDYEEGKMPAVGKEADWWEENAKLFMPEKGSRLGTKKERIAYLGVLIKSLIEEQGYKPSKAWEAVCDDSKDLGHFWDSENAKHGLEFTGSRPIGQWYDLGNTAKIVLNDNKIKRYVICGAFYGEDGNEGLACLVEDNTPTEDISLGWIVLDL